LDLGFTQKQLKDIYYKNDGYCAFCDTKLSLKNYGKKCARQAWEVDHGNPFGVNDLRNWQPACYPCNREKSDRTSSQFRGYVQRNWSSWASFRRDMMRKYCGR
jgi:hypothetical protein